MSFEYPYRFASLKVPDAKRPINRARDGTTAVRCQAAKLIQHILFVARGGYDAKPGRQPVDARGKEVHNRLALRSGEGFVEGINEQSAPAHGVDEAGRE
jgi:hypothetical protein